MDGTRGKIINNSIANLGLKIIKVAQQLLLVPIFLSSWGAAYYGEWLTLCIVPSIFAFSDLGFGSAASNFYVLSYAKGDYHKAADVFKTAIWVISFIICFCLAVFALLVICVYKTDYASHFLIPVKDAVIAVSFLLASRLLAFYFQLFESFYRAERKAALSTSLLTTNEMLMLLGSVIALSLKCNIIVFAMVQFFIMAAFTLLYSAIGYHIIENKPTSGKFSKEESKSMIKKGLGFLLTPMYQSAYTQGTTFIVRILFGAEIVAMFNTIRTVSHSVTQVYSIINNSVFPELQYHYGEGNMRIVKKIYLTSFRTAMLIGILGFIVLSLFGPYLYCWWTKNTIDVDPILWRIFMVSILLNSVWWTSSCVFRAVNQPYKLGTYGLISTCLSVLLAFTLGKVFGIVGAGIGYVSMDLFMLLLIVPAACKIFNLSPVCFFKK